MAVIGHALVVRHVLADKLFFACRAVVGVIIFVFEINNFATETESDYVAFIKVTYVGQLVARLVV